MMRTARFRYRAAVAHATVGDGTIDVEPGEHPHPDLVIIAGPGIRDLLAGTLTPADAIDQEATVIEGDGDLLDLLIETFRVPYSS